MKFLAWIGGFVVAIVLIVYVVLFTGFGNSLIKPSIEKYVSKQVGMEFSLEKFKLGLGDFDVIATLNKELSIASKGKFSILTSQFDLNYTANATSFNNIPIKLSLSGDAMGSFNNFIANGIGTLAGSNVRFASRIKDYAPLELRLDAKDLDLKDLSIIALKKPYINGKLTAVANIVGQEGDAKITAPNITINESMLNDYNITLPKNFSMNLNSDIKSSTGLINANTTIKSALFNANAQKTSYDFAKNELTSDFNLDIADLAKLEPIIKQKLKGSIKASGNTQVLGGVMQFLDAKITGLGGEILANLKDNALSATIKNLKLANILALASLPAVANSDINGDAKITNLNDINNIKGSANLNFSNGVLNHKQMNELVGADLKSDVAFNATNKLDISGGNLKFNLNLKSPVIENFTAVGEYELASSNAKADLLAKIADLSVILGSNVKTSADVKAKVELKAAALQNADIDVKGLGGDINAKIKNKAVEAKINNIEASNLFAFAAMDALFSGKINGNITLDSLNLQNLNGKGEINIENGMFNSPALSKMLGAKFPENTSFKLHFKPTFTNSVAYFSSNFISDIAQISKFDGSYNLNKNHLDASYNLAVSDLSKLAFLTGVAIKSPLNVTGKIITDNNVITATANSDIFSSNTNIKFAKNTLNADIKNAKIEQILKALGYDQFYIGDANANLNYSLTNSAGTFAADILKAHLARNGFTAILTPILGGRDITTEVYENGKVTGTIKGEKIAFNAHLHSKRSDINATNGTINTATKALNIPVRANYEKTDIGVDITGTTDKPVYKVSSEYLKQKAKEGIGKLLDKAIGKDDEGTDNKQNKTKELLKGLKSLF